MKFKLLIILFLLCVNILAASSGTFSNFTVEKTQSANISPDNERMSEIYPHHLLVPDYSALTQGVHYFGALAIDNTYHVRNDYSFAAFRGDIRQTHKNGRLVIGHHNTFPGYYLVYFEPNTKIFFNDGTQISMTGFYIIKAGQDIFDNTLYIILSSERRLADSERFLLCNDPQATCEELNIPLIQRY